MRLAPLRAAPVALLVVAAGLAGCLTPISADSPAAVGEGSYRFVHVEGNWTADRSQAAICGFPSTPDVDLDNRTIRFHNDWPGNDFAVLFLTVTWDRSGCGTAATSWFTSHTWGGVEQEASGGDDFAFEMRDDGVLLVDGQEVPRGGNATFSREGTLSDGRAYRHEIVVHDRGAWPLDGVSLAP